MFYVECVAIMAWSDIKTIDLWD